MLRRTLSETVLAGWEECPRKMAVITVFGGVVAVTRFTSMALLLYTRIWWWNISIHATSGLGVMAVLYVLNLHLLHSRPALLVVLPMAVAAIGTWFEVYERLFTGSWVEWPRSVHLEDTAVNIIADTAGATVLDVVRPLWNRTRRWRDPNRL